MKKLVFPIILTFILASFTTQLFPTKLRLTVRNDLGNLEEGVRVELYNNDKDYRDEKNAVTEAQYTDNKGRVTFKDLEPKVYFVNAVKGDKNNYGAGVQTDTLEAGKVNKVTIIIE